VGRTMFALLAAACVGISAVPLKAVSAAPAASTSPPPPTLRSLVAHGAKVKRFASGLGYTEGPLWLPDARLIVSDVDNDVVVVFDAAGHKSVFRRPSNVANGHALDGNGAVLEAEAGDKTHHPSWRGSTRTDPPLCWPTNTEANTSTNQTI
jgi:sugar lactone lactonase YvrE